MTVTPSFEPQLDKVPLPFEMWSNVSIALQSRVSW